MKPHQNRARIGVEPLDARCLPSGLLGNLPSRMPAVAIGRQPVPIHPAAPAYRVIQSAMSDQVSSDGSTGLTLSGQAGRLGRFTGTGTVDKVDFDPLTQRISASGSATWVFSNGDELHLKVSVFFSVKTRIGIEMIQFTGGAGRFTGATGTATVLCRGTVDPNVPSAFTCGGNGSLILILPGH